jgi:hypothetical protein
MNIYKHELKEVLSGIDTFVSNVGLTTLKKVKMNKYLDFKQNGKANPNPYFDKVLIEQRLSNIQTGFDYVEQLGRKYKAEGITPIVKEDKKESPYQLVTKTLVYLKSDPTKFYFRYQDHASSYLDTKYIFEGNSIERVMFNQYVIDTKTDYSKYQNDLDNTLNYKVMSLDHIKRIVILKQEYIIID